jgi:4-alpha-glucanotransferase
VVGEDLGTVPNAVRERMNEHGMKHLWVAEFEFPNPPTKSLENIPSKALLCVNTHDMAPFQGFFEAHDLRCLESLKLVSSEQRLELENERNRSIRSWSKYLSVDPSEHSSRAFFLKLIASMARSKAPYLIINAEDLWQEREAQNVPGTWKEHPNWQRKLALALEDWSGLESFEDLKAIMKATHRERRRHEQPTQAADGRRPSSF